MEHRSLRPLVFSASGGAGRAATVCLKRLLSKKWDMPYNTTLTWMRCKLSFTLLCSTIQCVRGSRSSKGRAVRDHCLLVTRTDSDGRTVFKTLFPLIASLYIVLEKKKTPSPVGGSASITQSVAIYTIPIPLWGYLHNIMW